MQAEAMPCVGAYANKHGEKQVNFSYVNEPASLQSELCAHLCKLICMKGSSKDRNDFIHVPAVWECKFQMSKELDWHSY